MRKAGEGCGMTLTIELTACMGKGREGRERLLEGCGKEKLGSWN